MFEHKSYICRDCGLVYYSQSSLTRHKNKEHDDTPPDLHQRFLDKYFNTDKSIRRQKILDFEGQPYSWNPIWIEVINDTKISHRMLKKMADEGKI